MGEWQNGLCGCFNNFGICLVAYLVPCYTFGKTAEAVGDSCCLCGLAFFVPILNFIGALQVRGKIREQRGIEGGCCGDSLAILFCPFCTLVQEAQEVQGMVGHAMVRE